MKRFIHLRPTNPSFVMRRSLAVEDALRRGQIAFHRHRFLTGADAASAVTVCILDGAVGYAFCSADDNFSRAKGRAIAEGRARRELKGSRTDRVKILDTGTPK